MSRRSRRARRRLQEMSQLMETERQETMSVRMRRIMRAIDNRPRGPSRVDAQADVDLQGHPSGAREQARIEPG